MTKVNCPWCLVPLVPCPLAGQYASLVLQDGTQVGVRLGIARLEPQGFLFSSESTVDETGAPASWVMQTQAVCAFPY